MQTFFIWFIFGEKYKVKFLIIIPAYNEENNILQCLKSIENQTFQDFCCVVVDDNSTDNTKEKVAEFVKNKPNYQLSFINHQLLEGHSPGAKVVNSFNLGLSSQNLHNFDIICKFDADIVFPYNYLEELNRVYGQNPKVGMASGLVYIEKNGKWQFENLSSKNHIRGPIKSYRKECFMAMNGLRPVLGWDNIDVMLCKMHGWETFTKKDLWVKHLRPTAYKYKSQKAEKLGEYFYNIGLDFPLAMISSLKSSFKNRSFSEFFITMKSFLRQKSERVLSQEEIEFIRNLRWKEMMSKFGI